MAACTDPEVNHSCFVVSPEVVNKLLSCSPPSEFALMLLSSDISDVPTSQMHASLFVQVFRDILVCTFSALAHLLYPCMNTLIVLALTAARDSKPSCIQAGVIMGVLVLVCVQHKLPGCFPNIILDIPIPWAAVPSTGRIPFLRAPWHILASSDAYELEPCVAVHRVRFLGASLDDYEAVLHCRLKYCIHASAESVERDTCKLLQASRLSQVRWEYGF